MSPEQAIEYALGTEEPAPPTAPEPEERAPAGGQREAAFLVAQGFTNRQVAAELMLSDHTAAWTTEQESLQ